jgi:hypothetical protein
MEDFSEADVPHPAVSPAGWGQVLELVNDP